MQEGVADYGVAADSAEDAADAAEDAIHETEAMDVAWQESGAPLPNKKNKIDLILILMIYRVLLSAPARHSEPVLHTICAQSERTPASRNM